MAVVKTLAILALLAFMTPVVLVHAQQSGRRGVTNPGTSLTTSTTVTIPVGITLLHWWSQNFASSGQNTGENRSNMFSVSGAPDYAIAVTVPDRAEARSVGSSAAPIEITGLRSSFPQRTLENWPGSPSSTVLRFGLLANPPQLSSQFAEHRDGEHETAGMFQGTCTVTVNYN